MLDHDYLRYYTLKNEDVIIDLGATLGEFARENEGEILRNNVLYVAVEPSYFNIARLSDYLNKRLLKNSILISGGTFDESKIGKLYVSHSHVLHTLSSEVEGYMGQKYDRDSTFPTFQNIVSFTLDDLLDILNRQIAFIKCDIEGGELETFLPCTMFDKIDNMAIAAYHMVNGKETSETLIPFLKDWYDVKYEQGIIYCKK